MLSTLQNLVKRDAGVSHIDPYFLELDAFEGFDEITDQEMFNICDELKCIQRNRARLDSVEKASGVTFNPHSLWWSNQRSKLPPSRILTDLMHSYLSNGCASW